MDPSEFIRLLETDHYSPANLEDVENLCRNYPMFNLAHMLRVRIKEALGQDRERDLKMAAIYASDRKRLHRMVSEMQEVTGTPDAESIPEMVEKEVIQFSEEPNQQADVIIEQHAPYAGTLAEEDLLELDEEPAEEELELDGEHTEEEMELDSETLIEAVAKEETELEEPEPEGKEVPVMDMVEKEEVSVSNDHLIRNFISEDHGPIRANRESNLKGDISISSVREHDGFITDTLAKIYVKQGLHAKAIYAYEKLSLKYPEKSAYFAAQIDKIKDIKHS